MTKAEYDAALLTVARVARASVARGWTQGRFWCGYSCCLVGGIDNAAHNCQAPELAGWPRLNLRLIGIINYKLETDHDFDEGCVAYNDTPGRTQEEILKLLDEVITDLEARNG